MAFKERDWTVTRHVCPCNCYDACGMLAYTRNGILEKVEGDPSHGYTRGKLCVKGYSYVSRVYSPQRLKYPLYQDRRRPGRWQRISWDEALELIASKILELYKRYGSHGALALNKYSGNFGILHQAVEGLFYSLGDTTLAEGSPCWPAGLDAFTYDFGACRTSDPQDMVNSKLIILWGVNPAWTAVHSLKFIYQAREQGAKVVVIDPVRTVTAGKADYYFQIRPGSDGALALAMAKILVERGWHDLDFLRRRTLGWEKFLAYLAKYDLEGAAAACGQEIRAIEFLAEMLGTTKPAFIWVGFGLQRHRNGGQNFRAINALAALTGNIGKPGGGVNFAHLATWKFNYNILKYPSPRPHRKPRKVSINNFAAALKRLDDPPVKFLWVACRNLLTQDCGREELLETLKGLEFMVTVDHFLTPTAQYSDLVLPATTHFEELDVVASYWHHWVGINEQAIKPYYESKSDLQIAQLLSAKLNRLSPGSCSFPQGGSAEDFLEREFSQEFYELLGITHWSQLKEGPRRAQIPFTAWKEGKFATPSGKYEFYSQRAEKQGLPPLAIYVPGASPSERYPYWLLTTHSLYGLNSQFQNLDWLQELSPEPCVIIHPRLGREKGFQAGQWVKIFNDHGELVLKVQFSPNVAPDTILCYQAWYPERDFFPNALIPPQATDMGELVTGYKGVAFYDVFVDIEGV